MKPIVEFCASNMHHGTDRVMKRLERNPDYEVIEYGCLGNCGECYLFPFAFVNGDIVAAETADELYEKIEAAVREQEAERAALDKLLDEL
ncbi:UDP-N-acetylmuramoylalanine--D-glutamate ligase [Paenibacillus darwinianus]|uniref:UDP-N-acetylmuramoylalanine--D-glutamate ligase n=1 Tax=Paenibacillus darwinianus TaxID=1380763 RepID=A0A9W5W876_9BACL|nr:YuzB family protein [Paenibacillus darwinianus]EXX87772.1 UDP-N-acetylmuramoylalanine--D-glutamate ligase [Paenibacillus darwinianus]EXX89215.1 UDP-N-acetylmuramoylalanine--D-glutamate ligase [Paenibacillus darwinianus]EXX90071.1 UDP-N-acetylmuramoylalanine--D-glutamate ligase [Paenibacillus darwinianus]